MDGLEYTFSCYHPALIWWNHVHQISITSTCKISEIQRLGIILAISKSWSDR